MTLKILTVLLAAIGLFCGLASAFFWYRSSVASFEIRAINAVSSSGVYIGSNDLEIYLRKVGNLNMKAALFGALAACTSTLSSLLQF